MKSVSTKNMSKDSFANTSKPSFSNISLDPFRPQFLSKNILPKLPVAPPDYNTMPPAQSHAVENSGPSAPGYPLQQPVAAFAVPVARDGKQP